MFSVRAAFTHIFWSTFLDNADVLRAGGFHRPAPRDKLDGRAANRMLRAFIRAVCNCP